MQILKTTLEESKIFYTAYYQSIKFGFDDFYEGEIIHSNHYQVIDQAIVKAVFSINDENKLSSLVVFQGYLSEYSDIFDLILKSFSIKGIIGITNDTFLMSEVVSRDYKMIKQACNYRYTSIQDTPVTMRKATIKDLKDIQETFTDFLDNYEELMDKEMLYLYHEKEELIALSNMNQHFFDENSFSIGIIVSEKHRSHQIARKCLKFIGNMLLQELKIVNAGCWYYNFSSKKALIGASFVQSNVIFRVEEI